MNKLYAMLLCCGCLLLAGGCKDMDIDWDEVFSDKGPELNFGKEKYEPKYAISFHQIVKYPRAEMLEMKLRTYDGQDIWINSNYFLNSKNIKKITLVQSQKNGLYDIVLHLDRRGKMQWTLIAMHFRNEKVAMLIDGMFYRKFTPELNDEESDTVVLKGPFDTVTAKGLEKYSTDNYEYFNDQ